MTAKTMAEVIREELRKGGYQMPGDTLPYETQANAIAAHLMAAGFGLVADAWDGGMEYAAGLLNAEELASSFRRDNPYRAG
jgi:hypothetical protein